MDLGYVMLTRTCPLVVLPLWTSLLVVQLYEPPYLESNTCDPPATNLPARSIFQVWARNIRTSPFVSPHESIRIWTSLLISSHVHHHPWTYSLMAQHLLIQVSHHNMITKIREVPGCSAITWHCLNAAKRKSCANRLARHPRR